MTQYIYLLQTREFVNSKEPIYKIGKTTKLNFTRFKQYPQGSVLLFQSSCFDCNKLEKQIIQLFKSKYKIRTSIGRESFQGNCHEMIKDFCDFIKNERIEVTEKEVVEDIVEEKVVEDEIVEDIVEVKVVEELEIDSSNAIQEEVTSIIHEDLQDLITDTNTVCDTNYKVGKIGCIRCNYFCSRNANLQKHLTSKKHAVNSQVIEIDPNCKFQCKICNKKYLSQPGLWAHKKNCKAQVASEIIFPESTIDLHKKIDNLQKIMVEMGNKISYKYKQN